VASKLKQYIGSVLHMLYLNGWSAAYILETV
jgi:hypothetical protein